MVAPLWWNLHIILICRSERNNVVIKSDNVFKYFDCFVCVLFCLFWLAVLIFDADCFSGLVFNSYNRKRKDPKRILKLVNRTKLTMSGQQTKKDIETNNR